MSGRVTMVSAGPGDPDLITLRGYRALQAADVVLHDDLIDKRLLEDLDAELVFVGKRCGKHSMPQEQIISLMVRLAKLGLHVVRLKGGDLTVFGRAGEEGLGLAAEGIPFEIVPGVSSAVAVPALAGIPVTHRGIADSFTVVTAHRREDQLDFAIPPYSSRTTVVILMGVQTLSAWVAQLQRQGYPVDLPVAFVTSGAGPEQRVLVSSVGRAVQDACSGAVASPTVAVVGRVVELHGLLSGVRPQTGRENGTAVQAAGVSLTREAHGR